MVSARLTGRPLAAAVLRAHADHLEWLDYVGGRDGIQDAIRAVRMRAAELGPERGSWLVQQRACRGVRGGGPGRGYRNQGTG
jgi:hypothetical protein